MNKIDLPDGEWASLRDPKKVPEKLRRPIMRSVMAATRQSGDFKKLVDADNPEDIVKDLDPSFLETGAELNDLLVVALVEEWSFETPVTVDAVLDLPGDVYDELRKTVAPFITDLLPDFGPSPDPKAPTGS